MKWAEIRKFRGSRVMAGRSGVAAFPPLIGRLANANREMFEEASTTWRHETGKIKLVGDRARMRGGRHARGSWAWAHSD
jgi:hypothetical protein